MLPSKLLPLNFHVWLAVALSWSVGATWLAAAEKDRKPNVIFILADDLGYGDLGCFGQKKIRTPHLDRMAREGMRFAQHYAGNAVCAPSRCVLMTGKYPGHAWIRTIREAKPEGQPPIPASEVTLAELLKQQGYMTGASANGGWVFQARKETRSGKASIVSLVTIASATPTTTIQPRSGTTPGVWR